MMDPLSARVASRFKGKKKLDSGNVVYEYSKRQVQLRNREKAKRLEKLRSSITSLQSQVKKDLKSTNPEKQMTALVIGLIDATFERVGNDQSAKEGHFGVTGWRKKHVKFSGGKATVTYVGKSGVKQVKTVKDPALVSALKDACEGADGDDGAIFGGTLKVDAPKVNRYLSRFKVTAKDLRGYHANREMQERLKRIRKEGAPLPSDRKDKDKILKREFEKALAETASAVGHEPSTLKSQYLVPDIEPDFLADGQVDGKMNKEARESGRPFEAAQTAAEFAADFFKRHPKLQRYAPKKILDKASGSAEASQHGDEIWLSPKFWKLNRKTQDFVFTHEVGHYVLSRHGLKGLMDVAQQHGVDVWDQISLPFGQYNMDEAFADAFASFHLSPGELKGRHPQWVPIVEGVQKKASTTVEARKYEINQAFIDGLRKDFLTLIGNIKRIKTERDENQVRKGFQKWRKHFSKAVFENWLNNKDVKGESWGYAVRKPAWDFYLELSLPDRQEDWRNWEKRVRRKGQSLWKELKDVVARWERQQKMELEYGLEGESLTLAPHGDAPSEERATLEGFLVILIGLQPHATDTKDSYRFRLDQLERFKDILSKYKRGAAKHFPLLLKAKIPIYFDYTMGFGKGGDYDLYEGNKLRVNPSATLHGEKGADWTLAHEMGHHIWKTYLGGNGQKLWESLVKGTADLDLVKLMQDWPPKLTYTSDFVKYMGGKDAIYALRVDVASGWQDDNSNLWKRDSFQELLDSGTRSVKVPAIPISAYAGKNTEEAFCEAVGLLVSKGPRAIHPKVRWVLSLMFPGQVKMAHSVVARYLDAVRG